MFNSVSIWVFTLCVRFFPSVQVLLIFLWASTLQSQTMAHLMYRNLCLAVSALLIAANPLPRACAFRIPIEKRGMIDDWNSVKLP
jgi:hypothetical protein